MKKTLLPLIALLSFSLSSCSFVEELLSNAINSMQEQQEEDVTDIISELGEPIDAKYDDEFVNNKITNYRKNNGIYVELQVVNNEEVTLFKFGAKGELYYFNTPESEEMILDLTKRSSATFYTKDGSSWEVEQIPYEETGYNSKEGIKSLVDSYYDSLFMYLSEYNNYPSYRYIKTSETLLDRECYKYALADYLFGMNLKFNYYVDKDTGICLKKEIYTDENGTDLSASFEILELRFQYEVEIPEQ